MSSETLMDSIAPFVSGSARFACPRREELAGVQARGLNRVRDVGPPLWVLRYPVANMYFSEALDVEALVDGMGSTTTFYAWDMRRPYPKNDPDGTILGNASVTIAAINANDAREITLAGLPNEYVLSRGDRLSFAYTNPTSSAAGISLHEVTTATVTQVGNGNSPAFQVFPPLPLGTTTSAAVRLKKPIGEFFIKPGSFEPIGDGMFGSFTIEGEQVIP